MPFSEQDLRDIMHERTGAPPVSDGLAERAVKGARRSRRLRSTGAVVATGMLATVAIGAPRLLVHDSAEVAVPAAGASPSPTMTIEYFCSLPGSQPRQLVWPAGPPKNGGPLPSETPGMKRLIDQLKAQYPKCSAVGKRTKVHSCIAVRGVPDGKTLLLIVGADDGTPAGATRCPFPPPDAPHIKRIGPTSRTGPPTFYPSPSVPPSASPNPSPSSTK